MSSENFKFIKPGAIRTRFAPSPTGSFHVGNARTALFNFLFSRNKKGRVILRLEDTDKERSKPEHEQSLIESLKWLGLEWDEGPDIGGKYGPYRQSERTEIYKKHLDQLLKEKNAYYCFCSQQDLETQKQYLMSMGKAPIYNGKCSELSDSDIKEKTDKGEKFIVRFKTPKNKEIVFNDLVKGEVKTDTNIIGDFSIAKHRGVPLFNLANTIDDHEMKITHVIRGDDHLSNVPKQILIQQALGFSTPEYAHLPMVLATDKSKLSKRKHENVSVEDYKEQGYLPESLVNFLAFLGWNPGTEREIYSMASLIKDFSLARVRKSGAIFNIKKLEFINSFYIKNKNLDTLTKQCIPYLEKTGLINSEYDFESLKLIIAAYQTRMKKLSEVSELTRFFFKENIEYEKELLGWKDQTDQEINSVLTKLENFLSGIEDWDKENLEKVLVEKAEQVKAGDKGYTLWPLRVALSGEKASASPFEIAEIYGKEKTLKMINQARGVVK